jgi:eukaryotic-like serine/threonine-protein kinase
MFPAATLVGVTIDRRYRVERVLGQGGMGVVVAARHLRLGQLVAIKFPLSAVQRRGDSAERLLREARATMRIGSEHVAKVHDVGLHESAGPYLVMEYLVGRDLGKVLSQDGPISVRSAVQYLLQVCEALAEAHAKKIVHRDLKPSNLFLSRRADGDPHVKVIDFGLVKTPHDEGQVSLTKSGATLGSPLFMAPEQMRGSAAVDARADIWALGATLYALVTGEPPFPGRSLIDVYERIKLGPPHLTTANCQLGTGIEAALRRCLRVDPLERYSTVADFADALEQGASSDASGSAPRIRRILESSTEAEAPTAPHPESASASDQAQATLAGTLSASWHDESTEVGHTRVEAGASWSLISLVTIVGLPIIVGVIVSLMLGQPNGSSRWESNAGATVLAKVAALAPSTAPTASVWPPPSSQSRETATSSVATGRVPRVGGYRASPPGRPAAPKAALPVPDPLADPD